MADGTLGLPVPPKVTDRTTRGRKRMKRDAPKRRLCIRFERGDTYSWITEKNVLFAQPTVTYASGGGKPSHRQRNSYNFIRPLVEDKVSASTQRVPGYEVVPTTSDPEDLGAAKLAELVALYGYDQFGVRRASVDTVKTAIAHGGAGFAMPYWEPNVGPYVNVDGEWVGQGDVKILTLNGNEVYWEPGSKFEDSRWWCIERARPLEEIYELPGYVGGVLTADAQTSDIPTDSQEKDNLAMTTEYFERPCPKYPDGRWLTIAAGRQIVDNRLIDPTSQDPAQPYPLRDADGQVIDEPLIHRLVYTHDPDCDQDFGLVWQLIDFQRTAQDCLNKILEYKNRGLNLQMLAQKGSLIDRPNDIPGAIRYYRQGFDKPDWEHAPDPAILNGLISIFNLTLEQMRLVAAYEDIHADPNVAAKTTAAVIEQSLARWQSFLGDLAEWHSRVMRHCLVLVARYYREPRLLLIRGSRGWESIADFRGAKLMTQVNVRVNAGSLEYLSKDQIFQRVQYYAAMGWVNREQGMAAIENGTAAKLIESYELDVARVNRVIQKIRDGSVMDMPTRTETVTVTDPVTGQTQQVPQEVPTWMPSDWDNLDVWQQELASWMKTPDFEQFDPSMQAVAKEMWKGIQDLQAQHAQRQMDQMTAVAGDMGMRNAARPQSPAQLPSVPGAANGAQTPSPA
jgi:hypothetical protein